MATVSGPDVVIPYRLPLPGMPSDDGMEVSFVVPEGYYLAPQELSVSDGDLLPNEVVYDDYEAFVESPAYVTRYEYEILNRLEFMQYGLAIMIGLIFILIFKRK